MMVVNITSAKRPDATVDDIVTSLAELQEAINNVSADDLEALEAQGYNLNAVRDEIENLTVILSGP
jgi:hypothetical protein